MLHRVKDVLPALAILVHEAERVHIRGAPKADPGFVANGEVQLWCFQFLASVQRGGGRGGRNGSYG